MNMIILHITYLAFLCYLSGFSGWKASKIGMNLGQVLVFVSIPWAIFTLIMLMLAPNL